MSSTSTRFADKIILVTGGASGIGEATVRRFVAEGGRVVLADINETGAARVADSLRGSGSPVDVVIADIGTTAGWTRLAEHIQATYGGIDVVVNNATGPEVGPILEISEDGWQRTYDTNVTAVWRSAKAMVPLMRQRGGGAFVNLSSNAATRATGDLSAYGAAKAAVLSLTRSMSLEFRGDNIRANAITPGVILSPTIRRTVEAVGQERFERGMGTRCGTPEELASVVVFLSSEDASYVNGETISVDGGWFAGSAVGIRFKGE